MRTLAGAERRATGRNAQTLKYDLLTALGSHACAGDKHLQRLTLRFITLIVARYNWALDELSVGQAEIARLWSLDERSVKREMARLRALGWLTLRRPAARGRVAVHGLDLAAILSQTRPDWPRVGSDFAARMTGGDPASPPPAQAADTPADNIIRFPAPSAGPGLWPQIQAHLFREDPNLYRAWFAALTETEAEPETLRLVAPSRFHASYLVANHLLRLTRLATQLCPATVRVEILGPAP